MILCSPANQEGKAKEEKYQAADNEACRYNPVGQSRKFLVLPLRPPAWCDFSPRSLPRNRVFSSCLHVHNAAGLTVIVSRGKVKTGMLGAVVAVLASGCGIYTFTGSSLPSYLKTVDIPLFINESREPDVAEQITEEVNRRVQSSNLLRIVSSGGDATIGGRVTRYENTYYTYDVKKAREANVSEYTVRITVDVEFADNKSGKPLYKGTIVGEGIYQQNESEQTGRGKAITDVAQQILQNSVQGW